MNIRLINYKVFTDKYIIYEQNRKGKEYRKDGKLIYEGEYLNGLKNGKGKEYGSDDKLRFEGQYLNDERWKGKFYDKSDNIIELDKENNIGKEYDYEGQLEFEGEFLNGLRNGKAKEYEFGELIFEGTYIKVYKRI